MANVTVNISTGQVVIDHDFIAPSFAVDAAAREVSETQFIRACVRLGIVTALEGEAYLARGELPALMASVISGLPKDMRDDATLKAVGASRFYRSDDLFTAMVAAGAATDALIDEVFALAAKL